VDTILLKVLKSAWEVGIYSGGYNIIQRLNFVLPTLLARPLYPTFSWFAINDMDGLKVLLVKSLKLVLIIAALFSVLIFFTADWVIFLILGPKFEKSVVVLQLLAPLFYFSFPNILFWFIGLALKLHSFMAKAAFSAVIVNGLLDIILIPIYGYIGPCIATISAELLFCAVALLKIGTQLNISKLRLVRVLCMPLIAGTVMSIIPMFLKELNLIITLLISAIGYSVCLVITRAFTMDDIRGMKHLLVKKEEMEAKAYG
jgi:O-antigen/teichoic acid export membrane protein